MIIKVFAVVIAFFLISLRICKDDSSEKQAVSFPTTIYVIAEFYINKNEYRFSNQKLNALRSTSNVAYNFVQSKKEEFIYRQVSENTSEMINYKVEESSCVDGIFVNVEVVNDALPSFHTDGWDIVQLSSKKIVWSSSFYDKPYEFHNESKCLDIGEYRFSFSDHSTVGIIGEGAYYKLRVNKEVVKETIGPKRLKIETTYFGYCSSDFHCNEYFSVRVQLDLYG